MSEADWLPPCGAEGGRRASRAHLGSEQQSHPAEGGLSERGGALAHVRLTVSPALIDLLKKDGGLSPNTVKRLV